MSRQAHIGQQPKVVAVLTSLDSLERFAKLKSRPCHLAEIRLDHIGPDLNWLPLCRSIQQSGTPVILTLRAAYEGGKWSGSEDKRLKVLESALPEVTAVDVELKSGLAQKLRGRGAQVVASYHNFSATPKFDELQRITEQAFQAGDIAKVSTMVNSADDLRTLEQLLAQKHPGPICVIGMGELGVKTRTDFPRRGSCLTYGFFEDSAAPGQLPAATLMELLR
jgi:3-dehydroquinate dehydratase I